MATATEELRIRVEVDTSGVAQSINKLKHSLASVGDAGGSVAGATSEITVSMEELQGTMKAIMGLEFAELFTQNADAIKDFASNIKSSLDNIADSYSHFTNSGASINPFSRMYRDDVEWEGWKSALQDFKINAREAMDSAREGARAAGAAFRDLGREATRMASITGAALAVLTPAILAINAISISSLGAEIYNNAQRVGMGTYKYQEWEYILRQTGATIDDLIGAQQTLTEAQIDVSEGSEEMIAAFKQIGLSADEVLGMNRQELFERTVMGLQNIENATQRAAIGYKVLSEDASTLSALLGMTNQDTAQLASNFYMLGGAMSESLINKTIAFQGAVANLSAAFRGIRNTLAELVLPALISFVNWVAKALAIINMFLRALFNLEITTGGSTSVGGGGGGGFVSGGTSGMEDFADSMDGANSSAQKLRRTLMGFDELNVLQNFNSGSSGGGSGSGGGGGIGGGGGVGGGIDFGGGELIKGDSLGLEKWKEKIEEWKGLIQTLVPIAMIGIGAIGAVLCLMGGNWAGAVAFAAMAGIGFAAGNVEGGLFDRLRAKLEKYNLDIVPACLVGIGAVGALVSLLGGNIPGAVAFATMAGIGLSLGGGSDIVNFINKYKSEIDKIAGISTVAIGVLGCVLSLLSGNIPGAILFGSMAAISGFNLITGENLFVVLFNGLKSLWGDIKNWFISDVKPKFTKEYWVNLFKSIGEGFDEKLKPLKDMAAKVWDGMKAWFNTSVKPKFTKAYWANLFDVVRTAASEKLEAVQKIMEKVWTGIANWFNSSVKPKFTKEYWLNLFEVIRASIGEKLDATKKTIDEKWKAVVEFYNKNVKPKFTKDYWVNVFSNIKDGAANGLDNAYKAITKGYETIKGWYNKNVKPKFTLSYWKGVFDTVKDGAKSAFNGLISIVEKALNGIIRAANKFSINIPSWVPEVGGRKFGIKLSTVSIPRLAMGGITTGSTIANIGENGTEMVLPLENNTQWMDVLARKIAALSQGPSKIILKVGERELGEASIRGINQITQQTGELQLVL